jgi:hypothetical protein
MASIEEVWGSPFSKKTKVTDRSGLPVRPEDMGDRVFVNPTRRTEHALQRHKKIIDDLTSVLPIAESERDLMDNYHPAGVRGPPKRENAIEPFTTQYAPIYSGKQSETFAYGPAESNVALERKIDRMMRMIDQNKTGYETPSTNDMLLYVFTGLFFLFTLDTFVQMGRTMRR